MRYKQGDRSIRRWARSESYVTTGCLDHSDSLQERALIPVPMKKLLPFGLASFRSLHPNRHPNNHLLCPQLWSTNALGTDTCFEWHISACSNLKKARQGQIPHQGYANQWDQESGDGGRTAIIMDRNTNAPVDCVQDLFLGWILTLNELGRIEGRPQVLNIARLWLPPTVGVGIHMCLM